MKQLDINQSQVQKRPIKIAGIQQNCFALDIRSDICGIPNPNSTLKKYYSLEKKILPNGYTEGVVVKDYPINSDSVSSYIESSDFRNDPTQAIVNGVKRVNLGDVSQVQEFIKENPVEATRQYADILGKVSEYFKQVAKVQEKQKQVETPASVDNGGANNG